MALMNGDEYKESIKKVKSILYVQGKQVHDYWDHPAIIPTIETVAAAYDLSFSEHRECTTAISHLTDEPISRFINIAQNAEDLLKRQQQIKLASFCTGECIYQCTGTDALNATASSTYDVDQATGTNYHDRFNTWLTYIHQNDLSVSGSITDVKGDRSKRPNKQSNPDLYTRIVERKKNGIVIRGAKAHQSGTIGCHEHLVVPTTAMRQGEEDYAVVCAVPSDEKGVIHVHQFNAGDAMRLAGQGMDHGNVRFGAYSTQMIIFDHVFVPWERVFLCGEIEHSNNLCERFGRIHRCVSSACTSGWIDNFIGIAQALADYNGLGKVKHIRDKITEMNFMGARSYACGVAAANMGYKSASGVYLPNRLFSNVAKLDGALSISECRRMAIDVAGGLVATAPGERDFANPEIGGYLKEFFQGVDDVSTEDRVRMFKLAHHFFTSGGLVEAKICGSGTSQTQLMNIYWLANLEVKKKAARVLCGIEDQSEYDSVVTEYGNKMNSNPERGDDS
ncbi:MAG: 4-hydroxybutyryl-CoA dehydratase [Deltaproteobacteria bacterium]|nr:4-hydroxybutyryl-CoA dehydratase [Deltaproteobacteria bacterium]